MLGERGAQHEVPEAVAAENLSYPPLAILAIGTFLRQKTHHEVIILDAQLDDLRQDARVLAQLDDPGRVRL